MRFLVLTMCACLTILSACGDTPTVSTERPTTQAESSLFDRPRPCCRAMTAQCLSCVADQSVEEYCEDHPITIGCPEIAPIEAPYNCRTREVWLPTKQAWCCENEGLGCIPEGEECTTSGSRGFPAIPCEEGLVCDIHDEGAPHVDLPNRGTCEEPLTCDYPYTLCKNRRQCANKLGGSPWIWRCVEKRHCKPSRCGLDANCDTTFCTRDCRQPRRGRFGHCVSWW